MSVSTIPVLPPILCWQLQQEAEPVCARASDGADDHASKPSFAEEMRAKAAARRPAMEPQAAPVRTGFCAGRAPVWAKLSAYMMMCVWGWGRRGACVFHWHSSQSSVSRFLSASACTQTLPSFSIQTACCASFHVHTVRGSISQPARIPSRYGVQQSTSNFSLCHRQPRGQETLSLRMTTVKKRSVQRSIAEQRLWQAAKHSQLLS